MKGISGPEKKRRKSLRTNTRHKRITAEINREAERDCPPIKVLYINKRGEYTCGKCQESLKYVGTSQAIGSTQARFYCSNCKEGITLPLAAFSRVEIRTGDFSRDNSDTDYFPNLLPKRDSVPTSSANFYSGLLDKRLKNENSLRCRLCNLPHYLPPASNPQKKAKT